jgi:hypothetical protein
VWGWLLLLTYTLVDVVLLFGGRTGPDFGTALGLIPRYSADIVPVLVVALGLVVRAVTTEPVRARSAAPARRWRRSLPALVLAACYVASALITAAVVAPYFYNQDDRAYVEGLRADLRADPRVVLFDGAPPDGVMVVWFGDDARVSTVVGTAPEDPVFDLPTYTMRMVDPAGRLRPIALVETVSDVPTRDRECVHPVTADRVTQVPLANPSASGKQVARISYYTAASGFLVITAADGEHSLPLRNDLNIADLAVQGPLDHLDMRLTTTADAPADATVCVVDVVVGFPTPG